MRSYPAIKKSLFGSISFTLALAALLPSCGTTFGGAPDKTGTGKSGAVVAAGDKVTELLNSSNSIEKEVSAFKHTDKTSSQITTFLRSYLNAKVTSKGLLSFRETTKFIHVYTDGTSSSGQWYSDIQIELVELVANIEKRSKSHSPDGICASEVIQPVWALKFKHPTGRLVCINRGDVSPGKYSEMELIFQNRQQAESFKAAFESLQTALR